MAFCFFFLSAVPLFAGTLTISPNIETLNIGEEYTASVSASSGSRFLWKAGDASIGVIVFLRNPANGQLVSSLEGDGLSTVQVVVVGPIGSTSYNTSWVSCESKPIGSPVWENSGFDLFNVVACDLAYSTDDAYDEDPGHLIPVGGNSAVFQVRTYPPINVWPYTGQATIQVNQPNNNISLMVYSSAYGWLNIGSGGMSFTNSDLQYWSVPHPISVYAQVHNGSSSSRDIIVNLAYTFGGKTGADVLAFTAASAAYREDPAQKYGFDDWTLGADNGWKSVKKNDSDTVIFDVNGPGLAPHFRHFSTNPYILGCSTACLIGNIEYLYGYDMSGQSLVYSRYYNLLNGGDYGRLNCRVFPQANLKFQIFIINNASISGSITALENYLNTSVFNQCIMELRDDWGYGFQVIENVNCDSNTNNQTDVPIFPSDPNDLPPIAAAADAFTLPGYYRLFFLPTQLANGPDQLTKIAGCARGSDVFISQNIYTKPKEWVIAHEFVHAISSGLLVDLDTGPAPALDPANIMSYQNYTNATKLRYNQWECLNNAW